MKKISMLIASLLLIQVTLSGVGVYASQEKIEISFGTELTKQEIDGYAEFTGDNAYEWYLQAKSELPDEVPVLERINVSGTNEFYVSSSAQTDGNGSINLPFKTIQEALDAVAALSDAQKMGGSIIYLRGGEYFIPEAISINETQSSEYGRLFIAAYDRERAVITAKKTVDISLAQKADINNMPPEKYSRMSNAAVGNMYFIDYDSLGIEGNVEYGTGFYYNDTEMILSRYPNQEYESIAKVIKPGIYEDDAGNKITGLLTEWKPLEDRPFLWSKNNKLHIYGRISNDWTIIDAEVSADRTTKTIKSSCDDLMSNYMPIATNFWGKLSTEYYYKNIFEELDMPGEFYADNDDRRIYFLSPHEVGEKDTISIVINNGFILEVNGASNVVFDGLEICGGITGISISGSEQTVIQNSKLINFENQAVCMNNTYKCGIINSCVGENNSGELISIILSTEELKNLIPRRNFVQNTYIYDGETGIRIKGSSAGNIMSHNMFKNLYTSGINCSAPENIIEYNEFTGVVNKIGDGGGVYIGGSILNRANTIRYNYFHESRPDKLNARAIYNDDCSDMSFNYGNVIRNFNIGLFMHSGDNHVVEKNTVINANTYITNSETYVNSPQSHLISSSGYKYNYEHLGIADCETWQTRYKGILEKKYQEILDAAEVYSADNLAEAKLILYNRTYDSCTNENIKLLAHLIADTGTYYMDNTIVTPEASYGSYGPTKFGIENVVEPGNGGKPKQIVQAPSDYDISELTKGMGLISSEEFTEKPIILIKDGTEIEEEEFGGITWTKVPWATYYKLEIATDKDFNNIVVSQEMSENEYARYEHSYDKDNDTNVKKEDYTYLTDTVYYVRVTAVGNTACINGEDIISDTVSFNLSDKTFNSRIETAASSVQFGDYSYAVKVEGKIPDYLLGASQRECTVILYEADKTPNDIAAIKYIKQITPKTNNEFSLSFNVEKVENLKICIKVGSELLEDGMFTAVASKIDEVKLDLSEDKLVEGTELKVGAEVDNRFGEIDSFVLITVCYDADGRVISVKKSEEYTLLENEVLNKEISFTVPLGAARIKGFIWKEMRPLEDYVLIEK